MLLVIIGKFCFIQNPGLSIGFFSDIIPEVPV